LSHAAVVLSTTGGRTGLAGRDSDPGSGGPTALVERNEVEH